MGLTSQPPAPTASAAAVSAQMRLLNTGPTQAGHWSGVQGTFHMPGMVASCVL